MVWRCNEGRVSLTFSERVSLFGLPFMNGTMADAIDAVLSYDPTDPGEVLPLVFTPNLDIVVRLDRMRRDHHTLAERLKESYLVLPDGFPIVWTSKICKQPLMERVSGSDLFERLLEAQTDNRILMICPDLTTADAVRDRLDSQRSSMVETMVPPVVSEGSEEFSHLVQEIVRSILQRKPQMIFICLGFPKQEILSLAVIEQLKKSAAGWMPLFFGLGASAEFYAGTKKRAPQWMRRNALEWLHRLLQEPRRLLGRYLTGSVRFLPLAYREWRRAGSRKQGRGSEDQSGGSKGSDGGRQ